MMNSNLTQNLVQTQCDIMTQSTKNFINEQPTAENSTNISRILHLFYKKLNCFADWLLECPCTATKVRKAISAAFDCKSESI